MNSDNSTNNAILFKTSDKGGIFVDPKEPKRKESKLLVVNGKVSKVGDEIDEAKYPEVKIIDLGDNFAYPGFNDSHVHLVETCIFPDAIDLTGCSSSYCIALNFQEAIRKSLAVKRPLIGMGFNCLDYNAWNINDLSTLDAVTGDIPIIAIDNLGHNMILNSAAMHELQKEKDKDKDKNLFDKDPYGGHIVKEGDKPTGMFREAAMLLAKHLINVDFTNKKVQKALDEIFNDWASRGYTAIVDVMGAPFISLDPNKFWEDYLKNRLKNGENDFPLRINYMKTIYTVNDFENFKNGDRPEDDKFRFGGMKLFVDGAYSGGYSWTSWNHTEDNPDDHKAPQNEQKPEDYSTYGLHLVSISDGENCKYEQNNIFKIVQAVVNAGFNMHYHVQGDNAIEVVLDAIDNANQKVKGSNNEPKSKHTLIHLAYPSNDYPSFNDNPPKVKDQLKRIKDYEDEVVTTVQPGFWVSEGPYASSYGDNSPKAYPIKAIMDKEISAGISTDYSVSPEEDCTPTKIMQIGLDGEGGHSKLEMDKLIEGITMGSAATTANDDTGKLVETYMADIVVYEHNLYEFEKSTAMINNEEVHITDVKVVKTYVGGRLAYSLKS